MRSLFLLLAVLSLSALAVLGCGQGGAASSATELAPAGSLMYGEVDLDPSGDQKQTIEQLAAKFPGEGSAGDRLEGLIEDALRESDAPISYQKDVEPWLGDTAAFFLGGGRRSGSPENGAALIARTTRTRRATRSRSRSRGVSARRPTKASTTWLTATRPRASSTGSP